MLTTRELLACKIALSLVKDPAVELPNNDNDSNAIFKQYLLEVKNNLNQSP